MVADKELCNHQISRLIARLKREEEVSTSTSAATSTATATLDKIQKLILKLNAQYPNNLGALCPLLLNFLELSEGQSFFMGPMTLTHTIIEPTILNTKTLLYRPPADICSEFEVVEVAVMPG